jgi:hypothetical protein
VYVHDGDGSLPNGHVSGRNVLLKRANEKMGRKATNESLLRHPIIKSTIVTLFGYRSATTEMMMVCTIHSEKKKRRTIPLNQEVAASGINVLF